MCLYFNILYDWLLNNKRTCKKVRQKESKITEARAQKKQPLLGDFVGDCTSDKQYERNLFESLKEATNASQDKFSVSCHNNQTNNNNKILNNKINTGKMASDNMSSDVDNEEKVSNPITANNTATSQDDNRLTGQQQQQQQQQQLPQQQQSNQTFKIRTFNRRHVDFDKEFDLNDIQAPNRSQWSGPFHFIQAADSQFGMIDSYIHHKSEPGWCEEIKLCENLVKTCNQMEPKPKFMIVCGDLVDSWPNTETRRKQVVDFKRIFSKLDAKIPLVCVCGNHDVGDEPTFNSVQEYKQNFGEDYFYFTLNDVLFIVINSQFYQHREFVQDYASQQDEWLESMLAKCKLFKYSIVFEHIPWFLKHFDEEDDYFNIKKEVRLHWLRKFHNAGVTKIMCGHYHRNAGGWYENMELVVTSAIGAQCGNDKSGVRIVKVLEESIEHQYYAMQDIPKQIQLS